MLLLICALIITAIATAATVKVVLSGKVFNRPRAYVYSKIAPESFVGELIRCPYCLSFWFSLFLLGLLVLSPKVWLIYCSWLTVQRLSNVFDDVADRIYYGQYGPSGVADVIEDSSK